MTIRLTRSTRKCSRASEREMQRRHAKRGKKESLYLKEMKKEEKIKGSKNRDRIICPRGVPLMHQEVVKVEDPFKEAVSEVKINKK